MLASHMKNLLFIHVTSIVSESRYFSFLHTTGLHLPFLADAILLGYGCVLIKQKEVKERKKEKKKDTGFNLISLLNFIVHFQCSYVTMWTVTVFQSQTINY